MNASTGNERFKTNLPSSASMGGKRRGGYQTKQTPATWQWAIEDYLRHLAAAGQRHATLALRGNQLRYMARCLGCPPEDVTAGMLVEWFGQQTWSPEQHSCRRQTSTSPNLGFT
jgi:hypothetical protein